MSRSLVRLISLALIAATAGSGRGQAAPQAPVPVPPPPVPAGPGDAPAANPAELFAPPPLLPLDPARVAGLPPEVRPEVLTWERVYQLALIREHADPAPRFAIRDARPGPARRGGPPAGPG